MEHKNTWLMYDENQLQELETFSKSYMDFLDNGKTERECIKRIVQEAEKAGYQDMNKLIADGAKLKAGAKVYSVHMNKSIALFQVGKKDLQQGLNILGAHIDSPRLDVKQNPLYEDGGIAYLDTHYYGGVKKYQWVASPMAIHGVVCKKDGTSVNVVIGEKESDPVVGISDLLIHLSADQMQKPGAKVVEGEDLNVLVGSIPAKNEEKDAVKTAVLNLLKETYDIEEDDFISAELEIVPAGAARDYGLDRSMIMGYGHDDRVCAYTSLMAILEVENPERTSCCILVDKEEVGSIGATGMQSRFFENAVAEMIGLSEDYSDLKLRRTLEASKMLSSDVSAAYDPNYPSVNEMKNTAFFGRGICFNKYTGSRGKGGCNDANPEFIARLRAVMEEADVQFQTAELGRVDQGGGGTIAYILANLNMDVIDAGIAVQNMHAPWEVVSKGDVYEGYRGYKAFLEKM